MSELVELRAKWAKELREELREIVWCERCGTTSKRLDTAHSEKRRFIKTRELYFEAVKLCRECHVFVEYGTEDDPGTHERMKFLILELLEKRNERGLYLHSA